MTRRSSCSAGWLVSHVSHWVGGVAVWGWDPDGCAGALPTAAKTKTKTEVFAAHVLGDPEPGPSPVPAGLEIERHAPSCYRVGVGCPWLTTSPPRPLSRTPRRRCYKLDLCAVCRHYGSVHRSLRRPDRDQDPPGGGSEARRRWAISHPRCRSGCSQRCKVGCYRCTSLCLCRARSLVLAAKSCCAHQARCCCCSAMQFGPGAARDPCSDSHASHSSH